LIKALQLCFATGVHLASNYIQAMKRAGNILLKISLCLLVCLSARADADTAVAPSNPYLAISDRNVFALVPIPVVTNIVEAAPKDPPPKITPNGIMSLFGQLQVLFKVAVPAKAGQPAKEDSYVMAAGERQNDIEVVSIDQPRAIIKFINHGVPQELPLTDAPKLTGPAAGPGGSSGGGMTGGVPPPPGGSSAAAAALAARRARAGGAGNNSEGANATPSLGGAGGGNKQIYNPAEEHAASASKLPANITPEEAVLLNYVDAKSKNDPTAALFPVKPADKQEADNFLTNPGN
jgi:hypothetical protein